MSTQLSKKSVARNYAFLAVMLGAMILGSIVGAIFPQVKEGASWCPWCFRPLPGLWLP